MSSNEQIARFKESDLWREGSPFTSQSVAMELNVTRNRGAQVIIDMGKEAQRLPGKVGGFQSYKRGQESLISKRWGPCPRLEAQA